MVQLTGLKWKRPSGVEYPKVWRTFRAQSRHTNESVEYCIQDLPESRFDDAIEFMAQIFCRIEPLCEAYGKKNRCLAQMIDFFGICTYLFTVY